MPMLDCVETGVCAKKSVGSLKTALREDLFAASMNLNALVAVWW